MTTEVFPVDPDDVTALLDRNTAVQQAVPIITTMAKAYTRGRGFTGNQPANDEIAAVIATAAARLAANSGQTAGSTTVDDRTRDVRSFFTGWTLAEQIVLNRYRVRAQ